MLAYRSDIGIPGYTGTEMLVCRGLANHPTSEQ